MYSLPLFVVETGIILLLKTPLEQGSYSVVLRVYDNSHLSQDNTVTATVCDCRGSDMECVDKSVAGFGISGVLGILGAILALLCKNLFIFF